MFLLGYMSLINQQTLQRSGHSQAVGIFPTCFGPVFALLGGSSREVSDIPSAPKTFNHVQTCAKQSTSQAR